MARGRPPKPTNLLELNGAFKKDPKRKKARKDEPKPVSATGSMPDFDSHITEAEALRMIKETVPECVLTGSDEVSLRVLAKLLKKVWNNQAKVSEIQVLMNGLGKLGMNPSDRSRLQVNKNEKPKNRWSTVG